MTEAGGISDEHERHSPMDVVREIGECAAELDAQAKVMQPGDDEDLDYLRAQAKELEMDHPLIDQEVVVYGKAVTADFQRVIDRHRGSSTPEHTRQTGRYRGLEICSDTDAYSHESRYRVVHAIHTETSRWIPDGFGNFYQTLYMNYVLALGSEVVPVLPVNAHSLSDLEGDPVVRAVDEIMDDADKNAAEKITALGIDVNDILAGEGGADADGNLDHQRASYINAFDIHRAARLITREVLVGDRDDTGEYEATRLGEDIVVLPDIFDIMPGYEMSRDSDEFTICGTQELFVRAEFRDAHLLLVPLKNVSRVDMLR